MKTTVTFITAGLLTLGAAAWAGGPLGDGVPPGLGNAAPLAADGGPLGNAAPEVIEECRQDISGNGIVDFPDLLAVLSQWGGCVIDKSDDDAVGREREVVRRECSADLDRSNAVDFQDLLVVVTAMGLECGELRSTP